MPLEIKNQPQMSNTQGFKFNYNSIKKCVMKKELGETTDDCRKLFKEMSIEVID
jgi:hypothetical protein